MSFTLRKTCAFFLLVVVGVASSVSIQGQKRGATTGPSSSQSPYVIRSVPGIVIKSILTVGDSVNFKPDGVTPYRMVEFRMVSAHSTTGTGRLHY